MKKKTTVLPVLTIAAAVLAILSIVVFTLENQKNIQITTGNICLITQVKWLYWWMIP